MPANVLLRFDSRFVCPCPARLEAEACDPFSYDDEEELHAALPRREPYGRSPGGGGTTHRSVVVASRTAADAAEEAQIALALALSLSLCDAGDGPPGGGEQAGGYDGDDARRHLEAPPWRADARRAGPPGEAPLHALSYESLVQLEAVRSVATSAEVDALPAAPFDAAAHGGPDARCPICLDPLAGAQPGEQGAEQGGGPAESVLRLPCGHAMHAACGRGYLTHWSKRCAEVHCRQSVRPCDADERRAA